MLCCLLLCIALWRWRWVFLSILSLISFWLVCYKKLHAKLRTCFFMQFGLRDTKILLLVLVSMGLFHGGMETPGDCLLMQYRLQRRRVLWHLSGIFQQYMHFLYLVACLVSIYSGKKVLLLPSNMSKRYVYQQYCCACNEEGEIPVKCENLWKELVAHIACMKPAYDLCDTCHGNVTKNAFCQSAGVRKIRVFEGG